MKPSTSTLYLRNVPLSAVRAAKAEAARRGEPLGRVVADALARSLGGAPSADAADLGADVAWYEAHRADLALRYSNQHVAIVDERVVDHDREFEPLATRVFAQYGVRSVFMPRVSEEAVPLKVR